MTAASNYLEEAILNHIFRDTSFSQPSTIAVALCTAAPTDTSTGSTITEPSGNNYSRQELAGGDSKWSDPSTGTQGETDNSSDIVFGEATGSWGTVTHVAILDATSGGNMLFYGALDSSVTVDSGDTLTLSTGDLNVSVN